MSAPVAALEARYRSAMRWYPDAWRDANEDALVGTLLDGAAAEGSPEPLRGELRNLAVNGLRTRLVGLRRHVPQSVRDNVASLSLGFGFGISLVLFVTQEWAPGPDRNGHYMGFAPELGPFAGWGTVVYLLWVVAFVLGMVGAQVAARCALVASVVASALIVVAVNETVWGRPSALGLAVLTVLALFVFAGRPAHRQQGATVLAVAGVASLLWTVWSLTRWQPSLDRMPARESWQAVESGAVVLGLVATVLLVAAVGARNREWVATLIVGGLPWAGVFLLRVTLTWPQLALLVAAALAVAVAGATALYWRGVRLNLGRWVATGSPVR